MGNNYLFSHGDVSHPHLCPLRENVEKLKMNWKKVERHCSGVNLFHNGKSANPIAEWQISKTNFDGGEIPNFLKGKKKASLDTQ